MKRFEVVSPTESGKEYLRSSSMLAGIPDDGFEEIYQKLEWIKVKVGSTLFEQNEEGDSLYILLSGRLAAFHQDEGTEQLLGDITPGETLGEMAVFTGQKRTATVKALRDSLLVRLSIEKFQAVIYENPQSLLSINQVLIERLLSTYDSKPSQHFPTKIFSTFSASTKAPLRDVSQKIHEELSWWGKTLHLNSESIKEKLPGLFQAQANTNEWERLVFWLHEQEQHYDYIILEADKEHTPWSRFSFEHGDMKLLVADAQREPDGFILNVLRESERETSLRLPKRLVLIQPDSITLPENTIRWTAQVPNDDHYHVRLQKRSDLTRMIRFLLGKSISVAMAGGGILGMSHIGVLRALEERGIPVDLGCGASAGANVSGQMAIGWNYQRIWKHTKAMFTTSMWTDLNLPPTISFMKIKATMKGMQQTFHDIYIEDMWHKYFCSSSNLTQGRVELFNKGPMLDRIRASCSLAPLFPPHISDGGDLLVDGALLANLPALHVKKFVEGKVIAVNVIPTLDSKMCQGIPQNKSSLRLAMERLNPVNGTNFPTIFDITMRSIFLNGVKDADQIRQEVDLYIEPPLEQFSFMAMSHFDTIVNIGYHTARPLIEEWIERDPELQRIIEIESHL